MHHAIILAHPRSHSFCGAIARTCRETLEGLGHEVLVRDLYAMGLDPLLKASELPLDQGFAPGADVAAERAVLARVESFIFVYPFWFNAPPAILKGYVDRVFGMNFGFGPAFGATAPLLGGKTLMTISTSGAPDHWVNSTGALRTLMDGFDFHVAAICGLRVLDHHHLGGVVPDMRQDAGEDMLRNVRHGVRAAFGHGRRTR